MSRHLYTLKELAKKLNGEVYGDESLQVSSIAPLDKAKKGQLSFLANPKYLSQLKTTEASAVLVSPEAKEICPTNAIVLTNPYLAFAIVAQLFDKSPIAKVEISANAIIDETAIIGKNPSIAANVVIGADVFIGDNVIIGANCVISDYCILGDNTELKANVTFYHDVKTGKKCVIHSGAVIGSDGFGNAKDHNGNWLKIPQLGGVTLGDNVEIGASTTIDRGAIDDTIIHDGVKLDNQIQVAHNVSIGENTAMAAMVGVAGSTTIGKNCLIAGMAGITGHVDIADNVIIAAGTNVSKSLTKPGVYFANFSAKPHMEWKRTLARISSLDKLNTRVKTLEQEVNDLKN